MPHLGAGDNEAVAALLAGVHTSAVVGVSDRFTRPSFRLAAYLLDQTAWDVTLVNPHVVETLGRLTHPSLALLPAAPDLVVVFRAAPAWAEVLEEAGEVGAGALWWCGAVPDDARTDLTLVTGRDLKVDHRRWCVGGRPGR